MIAGLLHPIGGTASVPARLAARAGMLVLLARAGEAGAGREEVIDPARVRVSSRLGSVPRRLILPDGRVFETPDNDGIDRLFRGRKGQGRGGLMARLEQFNPWLIVTVVVLGLGGFLSLHYGLPLAADMVAETVPYALEEQVGEAALRQADELLLRPSTLSQAKRDEITAGFARLSMAAGLPYAHLRLEFRQGYEIGANAFALPGGAIVLTDELVALLGSDFNALQGVLAHELGHVHYRHGFRMLARAMGIGVLSLAVTGDVASLSSIAVGLLESTARNAFSRGFEADADAFSVDLMRKAGYPADALAAALIKLQEQQDDSEPLRYFMSHPPTQERVDAVKARAQGGRE